MIDKNDWRLQGQEKYLQNTVFRFLHYPENKDHSHCEFCWEKIGFGGELQDGYASLDNYRWICKKCFFDFKEMFNLIDITDYNCLSNHEK